MDCGCTWRVDPRWGDMLDQCDEHRQETLRSLATPFALAQANRDLFVQRCLDDDLDRAVRGRR